MPYSKRVQLLRVMIDGHHLLSGSKKLSAIAGETNKITRAGRMSTDSGWLLTVLHTTRTLDTTLAEVCVAKRWPRPKGLGDSLHALEAHAVIPPHVRQGFINSIFKPRNRYMHEANAMPQKREAEALLSEMHTCLTQVLSST